MILEAVARSLALSLTVALLSGAIGFAAAWLVSRSDLPGRSTLSGLFSVSYAIPCYLLGMAWVVLGNPTVGLLRDWLPAGGSYGFWGMAGVLSSVALAFPYLELRAGFERLDPALEEAARMSGASPARVFRDVSLPLLWPSLANGMCLAFLFALSSFGVTAVLGLPVRELVLTTLIYSQLKVGGAAGLHEALRLAGILLAIAGAALGFSFWVSRLQRRRGQAISGARSSRPSLVDLGAWRIPAAAGIWLLFGATVILPWIALGLSALAPVAGRFDPAGWTLKNVRYVLGLPDFREALLNSLLLATGVATSIVIGGFLLAFLAVRRGSRGAALLIEALGVPFGTPGTVLAIGAIFLTSVLANVGVPVDAPLIVMAAAYAAKYSAVGARSLALAFRQVHPALEEAARVSGASTPVLLRTIWLPLLKKSLGAAWLLAALPILTELTMGVFLTGPGAATLGTILFQLQEYADQPSAAALAWMLLTAALVVGAVTRRKAKEA